MAVSALDVLPDHPPTEEELRQLIITARERVRYMTLWGRRTDGDKLIVGLLFQPRSGSYFLGYEPNERSWTEVAHVGHAPIDEYRDDPVRSSERTQAFEAGFDRLREWMLERYTEGEVIEFSNHNHINM